MFDTDAPVPNPSTSEDEKAEKAPEPVYGSAEEFLHEPRLPTYVRSVTGKSAKWCIKWYFHPEAVSRIAALWRSWEQLRLDPATGMNVWWRDHADHHMRVLLDPQGPFYNCDMKEHRDPEHLEPKKHPRAGSQTYAFSRPEKSAQLEGTWCLCLVANGEYGDSIKGFETYENRQPSTKSLRPCEKLEQRRRTIRMLGKTPRIPRVESRCMCWG